MFYKALRTVKLCLAALVGLAFVVFAATNHEAVSLSLFPLAYSIDMPLFMLVILSVLFGVIISMIAIAGRLTSLRHLYVTEKKRALTFETELKAQKAKSSVAANLPDLATSHDRAG